MSHQFDLSRELRFEAAHFLPQAPEDHKCRRLHGHSFRAEIVVSGPLDAERGWVIDFDALDLLIAPIQEQLDHQLLNEIEGLENPTSEEIGRWIWRRIEPVLPDQVVLVEVSVRETCRSTASYRGRHCRPAEP